MLKMKLPGIKKRGRSKKKAMGVVRENMEADDPLWQPLNGDQTKKNSWFYLQIKLF